MSDTRIWNELQHPRQHAEAGAQHRCHDDVGGQAAARRRAERRFHCCVHGWHIAQRFGAEQHTDPVGERAKAFR
jgi:hypothetical protein